MLMIAGRCLARQVMVDAAGDVSEETSARKDVQSVFIAALLSKIARLSPMDEADELVLSGFVGAVLDVMRDGGANQTHTLRCMESMRAACHSPGVLAELRKQTNVEFLWSILFKPVDGDPRSSAARTPSVPTPVQDVGNVLSEVRGKLGDVCRTWDRAGWGTNENYEANVRSDLERTPTIGEPCVVAKGLSDMDANELVAALKTTSLEKDENLVVAKISGTGQEYSVVLFVKQETDGTEVAGQATQIRLAALQLLNLSLQPSPEDLARLLHLIEKCSPEGRFVSSDKDTNSSLVVRVNAAMTLRNLVGTDSGWADLFCESCEQAAAATGSLLPQICQSRSTIPVFAHLLVLGVPEVVGCGQPHSKTCDMNYALQRCAVALQALLQQVLAISAKTTGGSQSLVFCVLRARLMKCAFEVSPIADLVTIENVSAVAKLALDSIDAPASVVEEALVKKLHSLYPLCADQLA
eukprot:COSAG06_NODE_10777_length_1618_cov_1.065833_2_plen_466_part_01